MVFLCATNIFVIVLKLSSCIGRFFASGSSSFLSCSSVISANEYFDRERNKIAMIAANLFTVDGL